MHSSLYLDEITNDWSLIFVVVLFLLMNVVLMNLLIAIMSNTYDRVQSDVKLQSMLDTYDVSSEYSRYCAALPPPLNVIGTIYELCRFMAQYREVKMHWPRSSALRRFDLFLKRNSSNFYPSEERQLESPVTQLPTAQTGQNPAKYRDTALAKLAHLKMVEFVERSRKDYIEAEDEEAPEVGLSFGTTRCIFVHHLLTPEGVHHQFLDSDVFLVLFSFHSHDTLGV